MRNSDFSERISHMRDNLASDSVFNIDVSKVEILFKQIKVRKSPGPDNISGRVHKSCAGQLSEIFKVIFTRKQCQESGNILSSFQWLSVTTPKS